MRKFIKGAFEIQQNVANVDAFAEQHQSAFDQWVAWADKVDVGISLGTSDDNTFLCEYHVVGQTVAYCKGLVAELKQMIKTEFPKMSSLWQGSGDTLY
ncbi:MAG: hypothetical protein IJO14_03335 [Clostridia bacterium]|nr:hypothetical protein [Clostridia bacterium]